MTDPSDPERQLRTGKPSSYPADWTAPDDEISLFDIWDALVRRRWLIASIFLVVTLLAAAYAFTRPDVYRYSTSVMIGHTTTESEQGAQREPIVSPAGAVAQLQSALVPRTLRNVLDIGSDELATGGVSIPNVQVESPDGTNIVHLRMQGSESESERNIEILRTAAGYLIAEHAAALESEQVSLTRRRDRLAKQQDRVQAQLEEVRGRLDQLASSAGAAEGPTALRIDRLEQRASALQDRLLGLESERDRVNDNLETLSNNADLFTADITSGMVARQQSARAGLAAMGIRPTSVISAPERSLTQAGTSGSLILALGAVLGAMLSIFSAFGAEFVAAANRRNRLNAKAE